MFIFQFLIYKDSVTAIFDAEVSYPDFLRHLFSFEMVQIILATRKGGREDWV